MDFYQYNDNYRAMIESRQKLIAQGKAIPADIPAAQPDGCVVSAPGPEADALARIAEIISVFVARRGRLPFGPIPRRDWPQRGEAVGCRRERERRKDIDGQDLPHHTPPVIRF